MNYYFFCCNLYLLYFVVIFNISGCIYLLFDMFSINAQSCQIAPNGIIDSPFPYFKIQYVLYALRKNSVSVIDRH